MKSDAGSTSDRIGDALVLFVAIVAGVLIITGVIS